MPNLQLETEIIYGPLFSRRLGRSLGVNILPPQRKVCSLNCIYCHYGATNEWTLAPGRLGFPSVEQVSAEVERGLWRHRFVDCLTFSGNGEPTLHPEFAAIAAAVHQLRDAISPAVKLALFSNATTAGSAPVRAGLAAFDLPILKLDAGDAATFAAVNRPCQGVSFEPLLRALHGLPNLIVQTLLVDGPASNVGAAALEAWLAVLADLRPASVQLTSSDYPVASCSTKRVSPERLRRIAALVTERTGVAAQAYWR